MPGRSALVAATLAIAASATGAATRVIEVDSRMVDCTGVGPQRCLQVRDAPDQPWRPFHGPIEGFAFEPGYRYRLAIEEVPVTRPPADASAIRTVLRETVRKLAVEPPADPFAGKTWRLFELQPASGATVLRPAAMTTLAIDTPMGRAAGKGGCNRWFATVRIDGLRLTLSGIGATTMACAPPAMAEERAFFAALARVEGYTVDELALTLAVAGGGTLRFRELLD